MSHDTATATRTRLRSDELGFIARISGIAISRLLGLFMVLPVMALWADGMPGATPLLVGLAVGGYGVTQALLQIPYGVLSDRWGRKPVAAIGLAVFLLGSAVAAGAEGIWGVILGRLLQGAGAVSATLSAWLADRTRDAVRTPAMAIFGAAIGASFLLALVLGPLLAAAVGVRGLFWLSAGFGALAVLLVLTAPGSVPTAPAGPRNWSGVMRPDLLAMDGAILVLHAALTAFFVLAPYLLINEIALPEHRHWQVYTLTLAAALPIAIPLIMRDGREGSRFMLLALALLAGGFLLIAAGRSLWLFGAGCTLFFAGFSYLEAALPAAMSRRAPAEQRGAAMGLFSSSQFFGAFVGGTAAGAIVGTSGAVAGAAGVAALLGGWLLLAGFHSRAKAID
ncbi:MAG: MFS transporter [Pseudomonadota bacterium]